MRATQGSGYHHNNGAESRQVTPSSKLSQTGMPLTKRPGRFGGLAFSNNYRREFQVRSDLRICHLFELGPGPGREINQ